MNRKTVLRHSVAAALAALLAAAAFAGAQIVVIPGGAEKPVQDSSLNDLLGNLTPEQMQELVQQASQARLRVERRQVLTEMQDNALYMPEALDEAAKILSDKPADTQADNIDRICKAMAAVDVAFAKPYKLFTGGKYAEAAAALKERLNAQQQTYFSAAQHFLYAEALAKAGKDWEAADAYDEVVANMRDRISFASAAALNRAHVLEKMGRYYYALEAYQAAVKQYYLTMDPAELERISKRMEELARDYSDPIGTASVKMAEVQKRLAKVDSGKETQLKEKEILSLLEDFIKTKEERNQQNQDQQQQKQQQQRQQQQQQQQQQQNQQGGPPSGQSPSSPAKVSGLPGGDPTRPNLSGDRPTTGSDDWAKLPPREREKMEQTVRKAISERYRDMISDYHSRLAEDKSNK